MAAGVGSGLFAAGIYVRAGAGLARFWGQEPPASAPAQALPVASLPELREELAQRLFCAPCPEVEACSPPPLFGWAALACALLLGAVLGVLSASCCCGSVFAGYAVGHHGYRPRPYGRITAPRPIDITTW